MLNTVIGKVFLHPLTKVEYGQILIPSTPTTFLTLDGTSHEALAENGCGNYFTKTKDGAEWFWDHETDELVHRRLGLRVYFPLHRSAARGAE